MYGVEQQQGAAPHLVDTGVDELLPTLQVLLYGGQVTGGGGFQEQACSFLLFE
jgi:hypothetical protein